MLEMLAGRTRLFIEIKVFEADRRSGRAVRLTEKVVETLAADRWAAHRDSWRILSFDADILRHAAGAAPDIQLVLNVSKAHAKRLMRSPADLPERLTAFCVHTGGLTPRLVDWAHELGKAVFTYTCNDPAMFKTLSTAGADGIVTDDPALMARVMDARRPF
jgi:glycerophosphoryl diester phosphodiesterase